MTTAQQVLTPYVRRHRGALVGAGAATIVLTAASLVSPWPLKLVIDHLVTRQRPFALHSGDITLLLGVVLLILLVAAVNALADYWSSVWLKTAGEQIVHDLRVALYAHMQRLSLAFHDSQKTGNLVTRLTGDVDSVGELFSECLGEIVSAVLLLVGMATVSLIIDPLLALAVLGISPLLFLVATHFRRRLKDLARRQRTEEGEIASLANESLSAMRVVKAFGAEHFEYQRVERRSRTRLAVGVLLSRTEARFSGLVDMLGAVAMALVVVFGVFRVASGHLTAGDLVVFTSYATRTYKPLRDIARQLGKVSQDLARAERVAEVLAADSVLDDRRGALSGRARGHVELTNVSFAYPTGRPALHDVSVRIEPGSRVAVVGASGAGKSTLAALVARFYDPTSGRVAIDGRDIRDWSLPWLREQVGLLLQDTVLFSGPVAANIAYASPAPYSAVLAATRTAGAHDFVTRLPEGYGTELGPRGVGLSGGQRQRIGIARVLLRNPSILILDEPTTGLDTATEAELMAGLQALMRGRTTIIITHSIELARTADRVLVLDNGRIVEDGTPDDLLARRGAFHRLARRPASRRPVPVPTGGHRRPPLPPDPALPELASLLDTAVMRPALRRSLRSELADATLDDLEIARVRYKPRNRVMVHYRTTIAGRDQHAVATVFAGRDRRATTLTPRLAELTAGVAGRCPGARPVMHDPASNAVITWCPFDAKLPGLAASASQLAGRLAHAGVSVPARPTEPVLLGYKPASRAVLRFGDHILKVYGKDSEYDAAVTGLLASGQAPSLATSHLQAAFPDLRLTAQAAIDGSTPAEAAEVAPEAGAFLRTLHAHEFDDLTPAPPAHQLAEARRHADVAGALVPELAPRLHGLIDRLTRSLPVDPELTTAHGDFHVDQLIVNGDRFVVLDFDDMCEAPAALDVATYAADVVRGDDDDVERVLGVLAPLCEGYGRTPDHIEWYLATAIVCRATRPFRVQTPNWPDRVRTMIHAADEVLR